jgi:hypothetical protein
MSFAMVFAVKAYRDVVDVGEVGDVGDVGDVGGFGGSVCITRDKKDEGTEEVFTRATQKPVVYRGCCETRKCRVS